MIYRGASITRLPATAASGHSQSCHEILMCAIIAITTRMSSPFTGFFHVNYLVARAIITGLDRDMSRFTKHSIQLPEALLDRYTDMEHGQKQLACTAGLLLYLNSDAQAQRAYRRWAQDFAEGYCSIDELPTEVREALGRQFGTSAKKKPTKRKVGKKKA